MTETGHNQTSGLTTEQIASGTTQAQPVPVDANDRRALHEYAMPPGEMAQGEMAQGEMAQGEMPQGEMAQGEMAQGEMPQAEQPTPPAPDPGPQHEATATDERGPRPDEGANGSLLEPDEMHLVVLRWKEIQAQFVDEPRQAIQDADALVADLMQRLAKMFARGRSDLESRLSSGSEASTEDLRQGLQRYRSFFERLLAA
jgi:uncharacterized protein involved in copper resistance